MRKILTYHSMKENPKSAQDTNVSFNGENPKSARDTNVSFNERES